MIRAFSLTAIVCLTILLFWYSRSGVARPEAPGPELPRAGRPTECRADGSCPEPKPSLPAVGPTKVGPAPQMAGAFREFTREAWQAIPLKRNLQTQTSAELHSAPAELLAAADHVGKIEEALEADASLISQGVQFFKDCAVNDAFPTSVRALCYHRFRGWLPKEEKDMLTSNEVPDDVRALADQLDAD